MCERSLAKTEPLPLAVYRVLLTDRQGVMKCTEIPAHSGGFKVKVFARFAWVLIIIGNCWTDVLILNVWE